MARFITMAPYNVRCLYSGNSQLGGNVRKAVS